jgi:hypothetical protein
LATGPAVASASTLFHIPLQKWSQFDFEFLPRRTESDAVSSARGSSNCRAELPQNRLVRDSILPKSSKKISKKISMAQEVPAISR